MLTVGLDARMWRHSGIGRYIQGLLKHPGPGYRYLPFAYAGAALAQAQILRSPIFSVGEQIEIPWRQSRCGRISATGAQGPAAGGHAVHAQGIAVSGSGLNLWHAPQFNAPLAGLVPMIVTIHDLAFDYFPQEYPNAFARLYYRLMLPAVLKKAKAVIAISQQTKESLLRLYRTPEEKIHVIYHGVDVTRFSQSASLEEKERVLKQWNLKEPYLLYVGIRRPRKNLTALLKALPEIARNYRLVLAGPKDGRYREVSHLSQTLGLGARLIETGLIEDDHALKVLYQGASLVVLPSLYEGFGFPLLEAMSAGVPVLASDIPVFHEIAGDGAYYFDPQSSANLAQAANAVLASTSLQQRLRAKGLERLKLFTWERAAQATANLYHAVA